MAWTGKPDRIPLFTQRLKWKRNNCRPRLIVQTAITVCQSRPKTVTKTPPKDELSRDLISVGPNTSTPAGGSKPEKRQKSMTPLCNGNCHCTHRTEWLPVSEGKSTMLMNISQHWSQCCKAGAIEILSTCLQKSTRAVNIYYRPMLNIVKSASIIIIITVSCTMDETRRQRNIDFNFTGLKGCALASSRSTP